MIHEIESMQRKKQHIALCTENISGFPLEKQSFVHLEEDIEYLIPRGILSQ